MWVKGPPTKCDRTLNARLVNQYPLVPLVPLATTISKWAKMQYLRYAGSEGPEPKIEVDPMQVRRTCACQRLFYCSERPGTFRAEMSPEDTKWPSQNHPKQARPAPSIASGRL